MHDQLGNRILVFPRLDKCQKPCSNRASDIMFVEIFLPDKRQQRIVSASNDLLRERDRVSRKTLF